MEKTNDAGSLDQVLQEALDFPGNGDWFPASKGSTNPAAAEISMMLGYGDIDDVDEVIQDVCMQAVKFACDAVLDDDESDADEAVSTLGSEASAGKVAGSKSSSNKGANNGSNDGLRRGKWSEEERILLVELRKQGLAFADMAASIRRSPGAIKSYWDHHPELRHLAQ